MAILLCSLSMAIFLQAIQFTRCLTPRFSPAHLFSSSSDRGALMLADPKYVTPLKRTLLVRSGRCCCCLIIPVSQTPIVREKKSIVFSSPYPDLLRSVFAVNSDQNETSSRNRDDSHSLVIVRMTKYRPSSLPDPLCQEDLVPLSRFPPCYFPSQHFHHLRERVRELSCLRFKGNHAGQAVEADEGDETSVRCGNRLSSDQCVCVCVDIVIDRGEKEKTSSVDLLRLTDKNKRGFPLGLSVSH